MDNNKLEIFRSQLLELRARIVGYHERGVETSSEEFGKDVPDMNDEASRTMSRRILLEIGDKSYEMLKKIDDALERIEDGGYGVCEECDEVIPDKRLELLPYTAYCVDCQEKLEKQTQKAS
ncbi:hypothetical protein MNBD_NITROSPINAE02-1854 [hydrothermal vent metagenome]|uniref:Uncharacterized protein n=1 Tax=hydrothermal vent metagenome TaxID=652676 RepID=A0A3B1CEG5_9ZZZZ